MKPHHPHHTRGPNHDGAPTSQAPGTERHRITVVGTGFSGLCMGVKLRAEGE